MLDRLGHLVGHRCRVGAATRRVDEREGAVVAHLLDDGERLLEVRLRLAGEPDDDVGAERQVGNRLAQARGQLEVALPRVRAAHRLEDPRRARLQRQVDVLADGIALGHRGDDGLAEVFRVRAREADPLDPVDRIAGAQELAELGPDVGREVAAPGVDVLAEQRDLPHPGRRQLRDLGDDVARSTALLPPPDRRHDAVRARRVAAHRHLHPRVRGPLAMLRQVAGEMLVRAEPAPVDPCPTRADPLAEVRIEPGPKATSTCG